MGRGACPHLRRHLRTRPAVVASYLSAISPPPGAPARTVTGRSCGPSSARRRASAPTSPLWLSRTSRTRGAWTDTGIRIAQFVCVRRAGPPRRRLDAPPRQAATSYARGVWLSGDEPADAGVHQGAPPEHVVLAFIAGSSTRVGRDHAIRGRRRCDALVARLVTGRRPLPGHPVEWETGCRQRRPRTSAGETCERDTRLRCQRMTRGP